ncbi:DNA-binding SARP family transcriptional activator [Stackebrandtia endophytica]|uniref:DNA-binding SARP family transcriptional activator n=1 Tax=Stackebrandtia endophytica TaxID=1496996 RepID=A0A543AQS6_9ACTN|nr:BTAD domain-containing putative transcriptional regulator [Stackebrandtia endophytica]TQL74938.1 DNA-binding SARP family transcriptional activator [Stackebrandtia endophytica]
MGTTESGLVVTMLGPVVLRHDRRRITAGTPKQACVLAVLAWNAGSAVPAETLIDYVWGQDPPNTARKTLAGYVTRLRQSFSGTEVTISCRSGAYTLEIDRDAVDVHRFRRLAADGRTRSNPAEAFALQREAVNLWHGTPLTGLVGHWADRVRTGLEQEHIEVWTDLFNSEFACGNERRCLSKLSEWVYHRAPMAQELVGLYMLGMYRTGKPAEALACFRRTRQLLRTELGIEPGPELTELHRRILRDDPDLMIRRPVDHDDQPVPRQLPAPPHAFCGRGAEITRLTRQLDVGTAVLAVVGVGGIGKTALAVQWAHHIADRFGDGQLFYDLRGFSPGEAVPPGVALAGFLRALGVEPDRIPTDTAERAALYRSLLAHRRVLIVCDNVRDAAQLRPLIPGNPRCQVIATSRGDLHGLATTHDYHAVPLDVLPDDESVMLLQRLTTDSGAATTELAELTGLCGGLPLALRLAASQLSAHSGPTPAELTELLGEDSRLSALDDADDPHLGLLATFDSSYRALDADARHMFQLFGAHPASTPDTRSLAAMAGLSPAKTAARLRRLGAMHLVHRADDDRWSAHDLIREFAVRRSDDLDTGERAEALDRCYDWYLAAVHRAGAVAFDLPAPTSTITTLPTVDDRAAALTWLGDRVRAIVAVIGHTHQAGAPIHTVRLAGAIGRYLNFSQRIEELRTVLDMGLAAAHRLDDDTYRVDMLRHLGHLHFITGDMTAAARHFGDAVEGTPPDDPMRTVFLQNLAQARFALGHFSAARDHAVEAIELLGDDGRRPNLAYSIATLGHIAFVHNDLIAAEKHFSTALDIVRANDFRFEVGDLLTNLAKINLKLGRCDEAAEQLSQALEHATAEQDPVSTAFVHSFIGRTHTGRGDHEQAVTSHQRAQALAQDIHQTGTRLEILHNAGVSHLHAGQPAIAGELHLEALDLAERGHDRFEAARSHHGLARCLTLMEDHERARHHRERATAIYRDLGITAPGADEDA